MNTEAERLEMFVNQLSMSKTDFCKAVGIDVTSLSKYSGSDNGDKKKSVLGKKFRPNLEKLGLNVGWYLTGEGNMLIDVTNKSNISNTNVGEVIDSEMGPIINVSKMTPEQAVKYVKEIKKKLPQLEKLAELAEVE